jgi:hypothetical protein
VKVETSLFAESFLKSVPPAHSDPAQLVSSTKVACAAPGTPKATPTAVAKNADLKYVMLGSLTDLTFCQGATFCQVIYKAETAQLKGINSLLRRDSFICRSFFHGGNTATATGGVPVPDAVAGHLSPMMDPRLHGRWLYGLSQEVKASIYAA